jgi:hypothetical protein
MPITETRHLTYAADNGQLIRVRMAQQEADLLDTGLHYALEALGRERENDGCQVRTVLTLTHADMTQIHIMIGRMLRLDR